jgi:hypothetical protein
MRIFNFLLFIALLMPPFAIAGDYAASLGSDCEPCGLIAKGKEAWNPKEFWTTKIKEINEFVEKQKTDYRLSMIERKRDKINQRLDDEEMKAMGIEQYYDPKLDGYLAKVDREMLQIEREILNEAIEWGRKCTAYAKRKLSQLSLIETQANAELIDPEKHIQANGYHSAKVGEDGKTTFYSFTERANATRLKSLQTEIEKLPKHVEVKNYCDFMRGGVKAQLIEKNGMAFDVVVTNYGYKGSIISCVLKYMHEDQVGTQLIYSKKGAGGMYMVFVTD